MEEYGHIMVMRDLVKQDLTLLTHRRSVLSRDTGLNRPSMSVCCTHALYTCLDNNKKNPDTHTNFYNFQKNNFPTAVLMTYTKNVFEFAFVSIVFLYAVFFKRN